MILHNKWQIDFNWKSNQFLPDTESSILCGEPFGIQLYLQHHLQLGLQRRLRQFFTHHLINDECKSHSVLSGEQHRGVCHRWARSPVNQSDSAFLWSNDSLTYRLFSPSGSALDLNFSDINVASLDKELEEQDSSVGLASKDAQCKFSRWLERSATNGPSL